MKTSLWAVIFSAVLGLMAKVQQAQFSPGTHTLPTNGLGKFAEIRAKTGKNT
jgi:hypothetical protein